MKAEKQKLLLKEFDNYFQRQTYLDMQLQKSERSHCEEETKQYRNRLATNTTQLISLFEELFPNDKTNKK